MTLTQLFKKIKEIQFINDKQFKKELEKIIDKEQLKELFKLELFSNLELSEDEFKTKYTLLSELSLIEIDKLSGTIDEKILNKVIKLRKLGLESEIESSISKLLNNQKRHINTVSNTTQIAISRAVTIDKAKDEDRFKYSGSQFNARSFCRTMLNQVLTKSEIRQLNNGQNLPVDYYCGGYNCRHRWVKVKS